MVVTKIISVKVLGIVLAVFVGISLVSFRQVSTGVYIATLQFDNYSPWSVYIENAWVEAYNKNNQLIATAELMSKGITLSARTTTVLEVKLTLKVPESQIYSMPPSEVIVLKGTVVYKIWWIGPLYISQTRDTNVQELITELGGY